MVAYDQESAVSCSTSLIKNFEIWKPEADEPKIGFLIGYNNEDGTLVVVGATTDLLLMISGLEVVGAFCYLEDTTSDLSSSISELLSQFEKSEPLDLVLVVRNVDGVNKISFTRDTIDVEANEGSLEYNLKSQNEIFADFSILRVKGDDILKFESSNDIDEFQNNLSASLNKLKDSAVNGSLAFQLKGTNFILTNGTLDSSKTLQSLLDLWEEQKAEGGNKKGKKKNPDFREKEHLTFDLFLKATNEKTLEGDDENSPHSPVINYQRKSFVSFSYPLTLDLMVLARVDDNLEEINQTLVQSYVQQLEITRQYLTEKKVFDLVTLSPYHFWPLPSAQPVTLIYPRNEKDTNLSKLRGSFHSKLILPKDRPYMRKSNRLSDISTAYLKNPHLGLIATNEAGTQVAVVYGTYSYHHYMQDKIDDNGWGCAYRSLQTIVSWFAFQGYTDKIVPNHQEIQKALVEVGDKPNSFIGSRQWIGSQEVSFVLDQWLGVTSKILFVNSGAELSQKGQELIHHFQNQGTPIMIGGGVLAHTILGVEYNQRNGNIRFLVLDPHYTGAEDLSVIQNKGWCGWKNSDFWDKTAFYNLCLPQRPLVY